MRRGDGHLVCVPLSYTGTYTGAVSGDTYKLAVSGTVGSDKVSNSVTVRCP